MNAVATTIDRHCVALEYYLWVMRSSRTPKTEQLRPDPLRFAMGRPLSYATSFCITSRSRVVMG